jgi:hypothetical protein
MYNKTVICYLREDVRKELPDDCPIINANPSTIYDVLKELLSNSNKWQQTGEAGKKFVEKYHNAVNVAKSYYDILK